MSQMRYLAMVFLALAFSGLALAQDASRPSDAGTQAGEQAARQAAVQILMDQIAAARITAGLSVGQFLDRVGGRQEFYAALSQSDAVGGPRWMSPQVCQVRLEITGTEIVADLANIAVAHANRSPIAAGDLPVVATDLSSRWFAATGTSIAAGIAPMPPPDNPWNAVPPALRQSLVHQAAADAGQQAIQRMAGVPLNANQTVGDAMDQLRLRPIVGRWLANRPITAVEYLYGDNQQLTIRVTLAASGAEICDMLRSATLADGTIAPPADWAAVRDQITRRADPPVGLVHLPSGTPQGGQAAVMLPQQPPDWAASTIEGIGVSELVVNPLRTARAAESEAQDALTRQVLNLPLSPDQTIGQAIARDPRLAQTIKNSIWLDSHLEKSDYHNDGSVMVRMSLDLGRVWAAMREEKD